MNSSSVPDSHVLPLPRTAAEWLRVFGPGAVVASLTIGTGELVFSSRGGALFGYDILFLFAVIAVLKWGLVTASARHMVLTGVHPYERMLDLPGPRGWMPILLLTMSVLCVPVWMAFHAGVTGNLISWITGTTQVFHGGLDYIWGMVLLFGVLLLVFSGSYQVLERVQMAIVAALLLGAAISLLLYQPDWSALFKGFLPSPLRWPGWAERKYPDITRHSVWVEAARYVGVIGGGSFDYLAYTSWLREKHWGILPGRSDSTVLQAAAAAPNHPLRCWTMAPLLDSAISFSLIILFSAVFVASGAVVLGPHEVVPDEQNMLNLQAAFVTRIHAWLLPLYLLGALLTMIGTLYGTTEVGVAIVDEILRSLATEWTSERQHAVKRVVVVWSGTMAMMVLAWLFVRQASVFDSSPKAAAVAESASADQPAAQDRPADGSDATDPPAAAPPRLLLALLTPVSLLTGVLACGLVCGLNLWMDHRFLPETLRMPRPLWGLNVVAGLVFIVVGSKGWWDGHRPDAGWIEQRWFPLTGLAVATLVSAMIASALQRRSARQRGTVPESHPSGRRR